jgi:hypothetical protein
MPSLHRLLSRANDAVHASATAWQKGGLAEVRRLVADAAYWRMHPRVRAWKAELPHQEEIDDAFDARFGVDTAGEVPLSEVGISGADVHRGHGRYRPVWTSVFHEAIRQLPIAFERFRFIDYGSGKGKALLLASDYPFEEIIGIEFARPLHEIAARNIQKYASATRRCTRLRSECVDALDFVPPPGPLVCFFFNPFDDATMDAAITRVMESGRPNPRELFVVYCNMRNVKEHIGVFKRRAGLRLIAERPRCLTLGFSAMTP